jgi:hypothetical protein
MAIYAALFLSDPTKDASLKSIVFGHAIDLLVNRGWLEPARREIPYWYVHPPEDYCDVFGLATAFLNAQIEGAMSLTVLVEEVDVATFSAAGSQTWSGLIAMLVLAFPEIRWIFMSVKNSSADAASDAEADWLRNSHGLSTVDKRRGTPIFDGYGLRNWLRERTQRDLYGNMKQLVTSGLCGPFRTNVAVVLDDEPDFRNFESLMAYNRGFRVHSVESWKEAKSLLGLEGLLTKSKQEKAVAAKDEQAVNGDGDFLLSIEDLYLNFPDQTQRGMSDLEKREAVLPALSQISPPCRRFVSVGHEMSDQSGEYGRRNYLRRRRDWEAKEFGVRPHPREQFVYKPATGLYALWLELGLDRVFEWKEARKGTRGLSLGFVWPPVLELNRRNDRDENFSGQKPDHSAPGHLLQIAQSLLDRMPANVDEVNKLSDAIGCAVRATDALELLGGRTPTLSLAALSLKHIFEVRAACQFVGVEYHLSISKRLSDIRINLDALSQWLHSSRKKVFVLNGEARILTHIINILEQFGQFEEAVICRTRLAALHRKLEMLSDMRRLSVGRILLWPANAYADWALRSLAHYLLATIVSILTFMMGFALLSRTDKLEIGRALNETLKAMFVISVPDGPPPLVVLGYCVALFGVLNFGLLVTYLYSKWKRL